MSFWDEHYSELVNTVKKLQPKTFVLGKVKSVDLNDHTCVVEPLGDGVDLTGVKLKPITDSDKHGIIPVPEIGSHVLVGMVNNDKQQRFLAMVSKIDHLILRGDQFGGLVKAGELKTQVDKNTAVLDAIKNILSGSPITEAGNGAPSALQLALNAVTAVLSTADLSNIENTEVVHG